MSYRAYRCPKCHYFGYDLGRVTRHILRCVDGKKGPLVAGAEPAKEEK